jgi:pimeloyl-ACP methyl ester carboxylesterase
MQRAMGTELPAWMAAGIRQMAGAANEGRPGGLPQNFREYDPEWAEAFVTGRATLTCDHENMLSQVKVPVLFTHHFRHVDPGAGYLIGAISDLQAARVRQLVEAAGNAFTYRSFPEMPHSMHGTDPATYAATVTEWLTSLPTG